MTMYGDLNQPIDQAWCGGCNGLGSHRRHCRKNPNYSYRLELADRADSLADEVGSNDHGAANMLYEVAGRLRDGETWCK